MRRAKPRRLSTRRWTLRKVLRKFESLSNPRAVAGMARFGIIPKKAYGLSTPQLRQMAREIGRAHRLAQQLWASGVHDARCLATLIAEPEKVTPALMEHWARGFESWSDVDGSCCHLFVFTPFAWKKALEWSDRPPRRRRDNQEFVKRAGFALMAYLAVHDKQAGDAQFARLLPIIERHATDDRNFVKKAVNWALRQIGKRSLRLNRLAIRSAKRIRESGAPTAQWVAADALRELTSPAVQRRLRGRPDQEGMKSRNVAD